MRAVSENTLLAVGKGEQHFVPRFGAHAREHLRRVGASHGRREIVAPGLGICARLPERRGVSTLHDRAIEVAGTSRRDEMEADAVRPGRLTRDRHIVRVAAKGRDVIANPRQGRALVEEPVIARRGVAGILSSQGGMAEKPERSQTIVGRDDDRSGALDHVPAVAVWDARRGGLERAGGNPHNHRRW